MSYDLCVKTRVGSLASEAERKRILDAIHGETDLDTLCEITELDGQPDVYDWETLQQCFATGSLDRSEFETFRMGLGGLTGSQDEQLYAAARRFFTLKFGQDIVSFKMPYHDDETRIAYQQIVSLCRRFQLVLDDPQAGKDINLNEPGEFPPHWVPVRDKRSHSSFLGALARRLFRQM